MNKKLLVHLCTAYRTHLIPGREYYSFILPEIQHIYLYVGAKDEDKPMYVSLIEKYENSECFFFDELSDVYSLDEHIKRGMVLTHGFTYIDCFKLKLHGFKNVHWICWGDSVVAGKSIASVLFRPLKKFMMQSINGIVTLMEPDRQKLFNNFNVKRVISIPYVSAKQNSYCEDYFFEDKLHYRVLLGNNTDCIPYHGKVLDDLRKYVGKIKVDCLLNYALIKDDGYHSLIEKGKEYFGDDFNTIENMMSQEEYIKFLKGYDAYICNMPAQTGLGACYRCLRLGKKLFLIGNNYDWFKQLGCKIYSVNELEYMSFEDFIEPLDFEQKKHNLNVINKLHDNKVLVEKWKHYIMSNI